MPFKENGFESTFCVIGRTTTEASSGARGSSKATTS